MLGVANVGEGLGRGEGERGLWRLGAGYGLHGCLRLMFFYILCYPTKFA